MNRKQFRLLLALGLAVGGAGLATYRHNTASWQGIAGTPGTILGSFDLNTVEKVSIRDKTETLTLARKNDLWVVEDRGDYPADWNRVKDLIRSLWELKPAQEVKAGPSQLGKLDLITPDAEKPGEGQKTGTLVEFRNATGQPIASLLLGKEFLKKSEHAPGEGYPAGRYVMPMTKPGGSVSLVSNTLSAVEAKPERWLNRDFFRMEKIRSVTLEGENGWTLTRESDAATEWKLEGIKPEEKLATNQLPSFNSLLSAPTFSDVLPPDAKADGGAMVKVETFEGFTYVLTFGKADADPLPLQVTVSAALKKEGVASTDEKPEDKEKADAEFAEELKRLEGKLAKEKALEKRVYGVSKGTFEALFKPRAELLEKKDEEKPKES